MCIPSYMLILILSLFSQGFSLSKSMRKAEDENMLLNTFNLGKALQNGEKSVATPFLEHYKVEGGNFLDEEQDGSPKFQTIGAKHSFNSHGLPLNLAINQLPYFALKGSADYPADTEVQNIESVQERRETVDDENSAKFPIGRRDFDMLRCMLGRVYRPCWQV
uniref:Pro-melanin concentrating hormone n=1 Tax=Sphenodon punctatus TaxID=8508 RepID=A0A8D0GPV7_SPHPU